MTDLIRTEFANEKQVYSPGDEVLGNVVIRCQTSCKANSISARFRGKSKVESFDHWEEVFFKKKESYSDVTVTIWSKNRSATGSTGLGPGIHRFAFLFRIPENAPCSYEGGDGWVRYFINVVVDIKGRFDKKHKQFLTVLPVADLNANPRAKIIPEFKLKEEVGFLGSSKYMTIHASCDKGGYVPGEKINVKLKFINNSDKDISAVKIVLEQKGAFTGNATDTIEGRKVRKKSTTKLNEAYEVKSRRRCTWEGQIYVPSLPPSDLPGCSIIDLQYRLLVRVKYGFASSINFKMPFVIGTIPLTSEISKDLVPLSYMESVLGKVDGLENDEEAIEGDQNVLLYQY